MKILSEVPSHICGEEVSGYLSTLDRGYRKPQHRLGPHGGLKNGLCSLVVHNQGWCAAYMDLQCPALPHINSSAGEKRKGRGHGELMLRKQGCLKEGPRGAGGDPVLGLEPQVPPELSCQWACGWVILRWQVS